MQSKMLKLTLFVLLLCWVSHTQVISRNGKVQSMYDKFQGQILLYEDMIAKHQLKMQSDFEVCVNQAKENNCTNLKVWQHERSKHSKNITNLQEKIKGHQKTIQDVIKMSQEETHKRALIIHRLLPELVKAKNDIEYIEGIEFLIKDTYLNIDIPQESIMNIFDPHYGNPVQTTLAQLLSKRYDHDPGAHPLTPDNLPEKPEEVPLPRYVYDQGPPLIDEVIFDGHNEHYPQVTVHDLFNALGGVPEPVPVADLIPDAVDVKEHDQDTRNQHLEKVVTGYKDAKAAEVPYENLEVMEIQPEFKKMIKAQGEQLLTKLEGLRKSLMVEQDRIAQAIADLEKAILRLHHKHAKQIVQIYIESKKLQREIFEKDDIVLKLDNLIHDCTNLEQKMKICEANKQLTLIFIQDLEAQKVLNQGIVKELNKLHSFPDKKIDTPVIKDVAPTSKQADKITDEIVKAQEELHQIAEAEAEVGKIKVEDATAAPPADLPAAPPADLPAAPPAEQPAEPPAEEPAQPPAEVKPAEEKPAEEKPAEEKPVEEKPVEEKPVEEKPVEEKPAEEKPAEEKPAEEKPAEEKPAEEKPVEEKAPGLVRLRKNKKK